MNWIKLFLPVLLSLSLAACGGGDDGGSSASAPGTPTAVKVAAGATAGTASVSFTAPASSGSSAITGYTVSANPGGITATGSASPITLTGLNPQTAYTYSVVATNSAGNSAAATTGLLSFYDVVETFHEPMTQPNDTIFTGTFTYDSTNKTVTNLTGSLTQSMTKVGGVYGPPMTTVTLSNQLSSAPATLGGVDGLLVTAFALTTTDTFDKGGFAPGGTQYFGLTAGTPNNHNAYAMIFVNTADPTTALAQAQIDKLAYADCTAGGMMMTTCMTGTTMAGYGKMGTMMGVPVSQVITKHGAPGTPTAVKVAAGATAGTASVSFTAPASSGSSAITGYTVSANPGGITATGSASPITLTGLTPQTAYTYSVRATNSAGNSVAATTGLLNFYKVVETFDEPMTQPNDTIFTGTFTYDSTNKTVTNLAGSLTQSMTKVGGVYGPPMTTVTLSNQLSSVPATLGGVDGLLVTTFALTTTDTFDPGGFAPGGTQYFGLTTGTPNNHNAYAMIFVNTADPTTALAQAQIDKLAYADCTAGGMMMTSCMTGTTMAGYGRMGTMMGVPVSQVITKQ